METTDFTTQDGRSQLQNLRRLLARAVSEAGTSLKRSYLTNVIASADASVDLDQPWARSTTDTDGTSNNSRPDLIAALSRAVSGASEYGGDYKTQLIADLADCTALLV